MKSGKTMKIILLMIALIITGLDQVFSQKTTKNEISGTVLDSTSDKPLRMASVSLLAQKDSAYLNATITNGDGIFYFKNVSPGKYRLLFTFVGYQNTSSQVMVEKGVSMNIGTIRMKEQTNTLNEIVITQERAPVTIKEDTVEFNAGSFKTQPNAQVEELLRKLPGMEVSRDGAIKSNGQSVSKVLVDGKPFFGNDPKMATRNLPADIVDKVQVYDQSSDQSQFSGIDDGNRERTINITIKKDKGKGYFGQNAAGIGKAPDDGANRYLGRLSVNRFNNRNKGPGQQISLIGQANNLNQQNFTLGEAPGPGGQTGSLNAGGNNNSPSNIVEVKAAGVNYRGEGSRLRWGKRTEMAVSYFANQAITTTQQESRRENILPLRSFITEQSNYSKNRQTTHRFNGRLDIPLDSLTSLRITPGVSWQASRYNSVLQSRSHTMTGDSVNSGNTKYGLTGSGISGNNNVLLMRKFQRDGRSISLNVNSQVTDGLNNAFNQSANTLFDSLSISSFTNRLDQRNTQVSNSLQNTARLSYTEPLSLSKKIEFRYAYSSNVSHAKRSVNDRNESGNGYDQVNERLSNRFSNVFGYHQLGASFQNRRLRYSYTLGFDLQRSDLLSDNRSNGSKFRSDYTHLLPNALFSYTFSGNRNLKLQYRSTLTAPSVTQLQPVIDNTNPLAIRIGNPGLKPEYCNTAILTYNASANAGSKSIFFATNFNQSNNRISSATSTNDNGIQTTQPVNAAGFWSVSSFLSVGRKVQPLNITVNLVTTGNLTKSVSLINDQNNKSGNVNVGQGLRLQSAYNGKLDYGINAMISYQTASYSLMPKQNVAYWSQYATADLHWQLPANFVFTSELTYNATSGRVKGYNQKFTLWNAALSWQFLKGKQGELRLQAFDLLNQNRSLVRNTGDSYVEDVRSRVLKRYFLVSFVYNLRKFGV